MKLAEFPGSLCSSVYKRQLCRQSDEDAVISFRISSHLKKTNPTSWSEFLQSCQLEEKETLNGYAKAGSCQFSALADQIFSSPIDKEFRPDFQLRKLALYVLSSNKNDYKDFMLYANPRTRSQRSKGGDNIDIEEYIQRMSHADCDGDHITLQAICDSLNVRINVVKWVHYEDGEMTDASSSDNNNVQTPSNMNIFVADSIKPRVLQNLDQRLKSIQLNGRVLWLSLHGEAHFKSLHCKEISSVEIEKGKELIREQDRNEIKIRKAFALNPNEKDQSGKIVGFPAQNNDIFETCGICLEDVVEQSTRATLEKCNHKFHISCISQWSYVTNLCPMCKERFNSISTDSKKIQVTNKDARYEDDGDVDLNFIENIVCFVCADAGDEENLLICDRECGRGAHTYCIGLQMIPEGEWYCRSCQRGHSNPPTRSRGRPHHSAHQVSLLDSSIAESKSDTAVPYTNTSRGRPPNTAHQVTSFNPALAESKSDSDVEDDHATDRSTTSDTNEQKLLSVPPPTNPLQTITSHARYESKEESMRRASIQRSTRERMGVLASIQTFAPRPALRKPGGQVENHHPMRISERRVENHAYQSAPPAKSALDSSSDEESKPIEKKAWADFKVAQKTMSSPNKRASETHSTEKYKRPCQASRTNTVTGNNHSHGSLNNTKNKLPINFSPSSLASPQQSHNGVQPTVSQLLHSITNSAFAVSSKNNARNPEKALIDERYARSFVQKLDDAVAEDRDAHNRSWPMMAMQKLMYQLHNHVHSSSTLGLEVLLNANILRALKSWLEPFSDGTLPPTRIRTGVIRVLLKLPARKEHVRASGLVQLLMNLALHKEESPENRNLILKLIFTCWSRLAVSDNHQGRFRSFCNGNSPLKCSPLNMPSVSAEPKSYSGGKIKALVPQYTYNLNEHSVYRGKNPTQGDHLSVVESPQTVYLHQVPQWASVKYSPMTNVKNEKKQSYR